MTNPFATRWVRPGALPYQFSEDVDADQVVERLRNQRWRGCIVGPHGSGKSTLLAILSATTEQFGRKVIQVALHNGQRFLPRSFTKAIVRQSAVVIMVDGYEQLGLLSRLWLSWICRRRGCGLLVSVHAEDAARGIPILFRTQAPLSTIQQLIERFLPSHQGLIEPADICRSYEASAGNVREMFFELYDLFERRRNHRIASSAASL